MLGEVSESNCRSCHIGRWARKPILRTGNVQPATCNRKQANGNVQRPPSNLKPDSSGLGLPVRFRFIIE